MLAATERGLGTVYLSAYRNEDPELELEIAALLELAADLRPVALIPLGYPAESPEPKELRSLEGMVEYV